MFFGDFKWLFEKDDLKVSPVIVNIPNIYLHWYIIYAPGPVFPYIQETNTHF